MFILSQYHFFVITVDVYIPNAYLTPLSVFHNYLINLARLIIYIFGLKLKCCGSDRFLYIRNDMRLQLLLKIFLQKIFKKIKWK